MQRAFAIVFSLLLVLGQWGSAMPSSASPLADACDSGSCSCGVVSCCVAPAPAPAPTNPATPAPSTRVTEQQLLAALNVATAVAMPARVAETRFASAAPDFSTSSVPLYCWNCTLLI